MRIVVQCDDASGTTAPHFEDARPQPIKRTLDSNAGERGMTAPLLQQLDGRRRDLQRAPLALRALVEAELRDASPQQDERKRQPWQITREPIDAPVGADDDAKQEGKGCKHARSPLPSSHDGMLEHRALRMRMADLFEELTDRPDVHESWVLRASCRMSAIDLVDDRLGSDRLRAQ